MTSCPSTPASASGSTAAALSPSGAVSTTAPRRFAVVGAGMAGVACARTLAQAGHHVTVFDKSYQVGGRTATRDTLFGCFDAGAQYFTVRDSRFAQALDTVPGVFRPWSATAVRILDSAGRVAVPSRPPTEAHWVASPGMDALVRAWALPLQQTNSLHMDAKVVRVERTPLNAQGKQGWQLHIQARDGTAQVFADFDAVVWAIPAPQLSALLLSSGAEEASFTSFTNALAEVSMVPCWTLMLAFPQAVRPGLTTLGPQWNAARSTHHRIAWLARESSKPGRSTVERWTVQANPAWSQEHLNDDVARVQGKLLKAFSEVTGIRAEPGHVEMHRWCYAQTAKPLGQDYLWDAASGMGACGDWCLGHRLEDAFISGLEMALAVA